MANRFLTRDELPAAFAEQARVWREQWRAMYGDDPAPHATPFVQVPDTITPAAWEQAIANAPRHVQIVPACDHCWHAPRDWQQGTSHVPVPRLCCWCGITEGPQHGPYAPEGG